MTRIVVGIDGSKESRRTLRFAMVEADRMSADLDVVMARGGIRVPEAWDGPVFRPPTQDELKSSRTRLQALVDEVAAERLSGVPVKVRVVVGRAVPVLLAESKT